MPNLFEGLKAGDLEDLVLPMISVDEYESKLDDDSIVVAFYVSDREPSQDLNRFIQKGAVNLLDTDVSPAPNADGYYMVFVELLRDTNTPKKIMDLLDSLEGLTSLKNWKVQIHGLDNVLPATLESISTNLRVETIDESEEVDETEESLIEFFRQSDLDDLVVQGSRVVMEARGVSVEFQFVDQGNLSDVFENNAVMGSATRLDEAANANCRRVQRMLGDLWIAEQRGEHMLVSHALREGVALFRL